MSFLYKSNITSSLGSVWEILHFPRGKQWGSLPDVSKLFRQSLVNCIDKRSDGGGVILEFNASSCEKSVCVRTVHKCLICLLLTYVSYWSPASGLVWVTCGKQNKFYSHLFWEGKTLWGQRLCRRHKICWCSSWCLSLHVAPWCFVEGRIAHSIAHPSPGAAALPWALYGRVELQWGSTTSNNPQRFSKGLFCFVPALPLHRIAAVELCKSLALSRVKALLVILQWSFKMSV